MSQTWTADEELAERIQNAPKPLIANRIKEARKTADLTLDRLGDLIGGVTRQHLIKLEKGIHRPRAAMLRSIATATDREVDWFLDPEVDPKPGPFPDDGSG